MAREVSANQRIARQNKELKKTKELFRDLSKQPPVCFPKKRKALIVPSKHGVYVIFDKVDRVLHVGRTYRARRGLWQRLKDHLNGQSSFVHTYLNGNKNRLRKG
jgi:hypothetical protein